jgi:F-type H+-transporting ATPase subunit b
LGFDKSNLKQNLKILIMTTANITLAVFSFVNLFISVDSGKKDTLLSVEPGLMIWTVIIFLILLFLLKKYAWKPLLNSLNNREQGIKDTIDRAEKLREEAEKILEENKKRLEAADDQSRKIINESKELAEKLKSELIAKTGEETNRMIQQAKSEIDREKQAAIDKLKDEVGSLAVQAASKIIDENLDEKKQKKILESFINQIPKN